MKRSLQTKTRWWIKWVRHLPEGVLRHMMDGPFKTKSQAHLAQATIGQQELATQFVIWSTPLLPQAKK